MSLVRVAVALAVISGPVFAADESQTETLAGRIDTLLQRRAAQRAFWGVQAIELATGKVRYQRNAGKLFVPASNAKLFSTALALERLGPDYRFRTVLGTDAEVEEGVIKGDLLLIGGGDPNFSSRVIPYDPETEFRDDRLEPIRELADKLVAEGVTKVDGDIIGDDSRYVWDPYPSGWAIGDALWGYGAPVSALTFNDSAIEILVRPSAPGQPARLRVDPAVDFYKITNLTKTAATRRVARSIGMDRTEDGDGIEIWGEISVRSPGRDLNVAAADPALYAAAMLKYVLEEAGVEITGEPRAKHNEPHQVPDLKNAPRSEIANPETVFAELSSVPLSAIIRIINKESQNLHAEMLFREVGRQQHGVGSVEAAIEATRDFLDESGLSPWEFFLNDASGLSRQNLVSPAGTVKLLKRMWGSERRDVYIGSLAVGGQDGTLDWRFSRGPVKGLVRAKTGTLSHITALAGYATDAAGEELAFAVFVNNFGVSTSYIRSIVDAIVVELLTHPSVIKVSEPPA